MLALDEIIPYENNPRNNEPAVDAVIASIVSFGFRVPLLVDRNNVLVAGHTRLEAVKRIIQRDPTRAADLGQLPCFRADDLTEDQVRAFRLVDNKTSELAEWNFDMLATEVELLTEAGINLTEFGWAQEEIDCLKSVVAEDCLDPSTWERPAEEADGVNGAMTAARSLSHSADGSSVRVTIGTFGFMILRDDYEKWAEAVMAENSFDFERVNDEAARRLGLLEAKQARTNFLSSVYSTNAAAPVTVAEQKDEETANLEA
jgi:site-specific DNA-methyltransferase (adenine-specific)